MDGLERNRHRDIHRDIGASGEPDVITQTFDPAAASGVCFQEGRDHPWCVWAHTISVSVVAQCALAQYLLLHSVLWTFESP